MPTKHVTHSYGRFVCPLPIVAFTNALINALINVPPFSLSIHPLQYVVAHIVVIEARQAQARRVETMLSSNRHDVTVCKTAQEGLRLMREGALVDLIVVSATLPDGSGIEFAARLRQDASLYSTPLLMTAEDVTHRMRGLEIIDDFVLEPLGAKELLTRVDVLLRRNAKPSSLQGRFEVIGGVEVAVQIIALAHPHGALMFDDGTIFYFVHGRIVHALHASLHGEAIVKNVIRRQAGAFRFQPYVIPETTSMNIDPLTLLLKLHQDATDLSEDDIDNMPAKNTLEKSTLLDRMTQPNLDQLNNLEGRLETMGGTQSVLSILARSYEQGALMFDDNVTIYLHQGIIKHVMHPRLEGEAALRAVIKRRQGKFHFEPHVAAPMNSLNIRLEALLLALAKEADEARRDRQRSSEVPTVDLERDGILIFPSFKLAYTYIEMMNNVQTFNVYEGRDSRQQRSCLVLAGRLLTIVALNSSLNDVSDGLQRLRVTY